MLSESNRQNLKYFVKVLFAMFSVLFLIITSSGVWNGVTLGAIEPFYGWIAGANFVITGYAFYKLFRPWLDKK